MTSAFWFQHKPSDEREEALLSKARRVSLTFLWLALSALFAAVTILSLDGKTSTSFVMIALLTIEFGSYVAGWWVIRNETFEKHQK